MRSLVNSMHLLGVIKTALNRHVEAKRVEYLAMTGVRV